MGVKVVIGPAGSGKTCRCITALRTAEKEERPAILIVPDQFTYAADRLLLDNPAIDGIRNVRITSFSRLSQNRSVVQNILSEQGRRMLLRRVVDEATSDQLGPLGRIRETIGFVDALATSLKETKGIAGRRAADDLFAAAGDNQKVIALANLIRAYDSAAEAGGLTDPEEAVHDLAESLIKTPGKLAHTEIWVDSFASFTPGDKVLLAALAHVAPMLQITLCCDVDDARLALSRADEASSFGLSPSTNSFWLHLRPQLTRPAFLPSLRTLIWLQQTFREQFLTPDNLTSTTHRFHQAEELSRLETNLFREAPLIGKSSMPAPLEPKTDPETNTEIEAGRISRVTTRRFSHPYHEVLSWAGWIDNWTRLSDAPIHYRDIAVTIKNVELYSPLLTEIFARYQIPFFTDQRRDATAHPIIKLALAALRIAHQGWHREAVIGLLRNPILGLSADLVDRVENLSLENGIQYERWWRTDWASPLLPEREKFNQSHDNTGHDHGSVNESETEKHSLHPAANQQKRFDPAARRRLLASAEANAVSDYAFGPLRCFTDLWRECEPDFSLIAMRLNQLILYFLENGREDPLESDSARSSFPPMNQINPDDANETQIHLSAALAEREFITWDSAANQQILLLLQNILSTGSDLMGNVKISISLMIRLLRDAFANASIGQTPRWLDAVIIAEPRRSRVNEAARVIIGGLDAVNIPRAHSQDPLFSDAERDELASRGLPVAANAILQAEEDPYLFYIACTRATDEIRLTYAGGSADGSSCEPSTYLGEVSRAIGPRPESPSVSPSGLSSCRQQWELPARLAATMVTMPDDSARRLTDSAHRELPDATADVDRAWDCRNKIKRPLPDNLLPETATLLAPDNQLASSASRLETFVKCPFRHFARFCLRLEPRPEAILTPRSTGSAVHTALQRFFARPRREPDPDAAAAEIRRIFADLALEDEYKIFQSDPPSAYRWQRTGHGLELFVRTEFDRLIKNEFQPNALELSFGLGPSTVDPLEYARALTNGERFSQCVLPALEIPIPSGAILQPEEITNATWRLKLRGQIDRLDIAVGPDKIYNALVIDYKQNPQTRNVVNDLAEGTDLQLAVYLLVALSMLELAPAGGVYYGYAPQTRKVRDTVKESNKYKFGMDGLIVCTTRSQIDPTGGFFKSRLKTLPESAQDGLEAVLLKTRERIANLAADIINGDIRPLPRQTGSTLACQYCDFIDVCRFDPRRDPIRHPGTEEVACGK